MSGVIRGPREGWLSLLLLAVVVMTPAISLAEAAWVDDLDIVPRLAFFALLLGVVLAKLPVRGWIAHLFATEFGLALIGFYFAAGMSGADWLERFDSLRGRIWAWGEAAFGGGMSNDTMLFALLMALLGWFLGYASGWLVFRKHNVWIPMVANGSALLVNLSYSPPDSVTYFLVFVVASMLLLMRVTLYKREKDWNRADAEYNRSLTWSFLWKGGVLSGGIIALAWLMPLGTVNASVADNWNQITAPWQGLQGEFDRVFASVGASSAKAEGNRFTRTLALKGAIELGPEMVMQVSSPKPEYWGTQAYDKYTGQGWMSSTPETVRLDANDNRLVDTSRYQGRADIEQHFRILVARNTSIFAATSPVKLSLPVNADQFGTLDDLASLKSLIPMRAGQQYSVISSVSTASAEELRQAGTDYPEWVKDRYLQLPESSNRHYFSSSLRRVQQMARRVTAGTTNAYDAAEQVEKYLRGFKYDINVAAPPPNRDAVDWFLFTSREGYCDYFASSMAVMARSIGIPARVVTGYNTGTFNQATGLYDVRQENAHSWPELFFPKYGWVQFEPTPSQPASTRPEAPSTTQTQGPTDPIGDSAQALSLEQQARDKMLLDNLDLSQSLDTGDGSAPIEQIDERPVLAVLGGIGLVALVALVLWRRGLSGLSPAEWAYLQTYAIAGLLGWKLKPSYTPVEYGRVLSSASPELEPDLKRVVSSYVEQTYGGKSTTDDEVRESWSRIRAKLPWVLLRRRFGR